jgi:signal transduction histidine kinase
LSELDEATGWLAARAADAPDNFLHLSRLLEAERAWALGDFRAAALGFDAARREAAGRPRPWHRALITERAARFSLAHGLDHAGYAPARPRPRALPGLGGEGEGGPTRLCLPHPATNPDTTVGVDEPTDGPRGRAGVSTGTLDLLGILSASQALSAQTKIEQLHTRVVEVLGAMTGATAVHLLLWDNDRHDWLRPTPADGTTPINGTGHQHELPTSVLRYVQRTGEPLVVADATGDDRFARDPYFTNLNYCSLLAVPILSRGSPRAVLLLENRLLRGTFTTDRLDAVTLIAGQLAVTLDNAQLYTELTASRARIVAAADYSRRRIERDLHDGTQQRLLSLALRLRLAQAALPPESGELAAQLDSLVSEATSALDELRELARGIHPVVLVEGGLHAALEALALRSTVPVELNVRVDERLPEQIEIARPLGGDGDHGEVEARTGHAEGLRCASRGPCRLCRRCAAAWCPAPRRHVRRAAAARPPPRSWPPSPSGRSAARPGQSAGRRGGRPARRTPRAARCSPRASPCCRRTSRAGRARPPGRGSTLCRQSRKPCSRCTPTCR